MAGAFIVALLAALELSANPEGVTIPFLNWITIGDFTANWAFRVDTLSVTMMLVVSGVGTLIHIYAIGYMHEDVRHNGDPGALPPLLRLPQPVHRRDDDPGQRRQLS